MDKRLANLEPGTVGDKRSLEIALRPQYVANLVVAHRKVASVRATLRGRFSATVCSCSEVKRSRDSPRVAKVDPSPYIVGCETSDFSEG
jgi:hypothetical protein